MALLIDGYNLLHASGVFPAKHLPGTLHNARTALLTELVELLPERDLRQTIIVFDSAEAPPGLPDRIHFQGLDVRFATNHADADELIEILIDESLSPRDLIVVSSDHRLHRAARRRKATPMDSDLWFLGLQARQHLVQEERASAKPQHPLTEGEVAFWLKKFGDEAGQGSTKRKNENQTKAAEPPPTTPDATADTQPDSAADTDANRPKPEVYNPFPPGYADDLFEEE